jgi:hypothetical protein
MAWSKLPAIEQKNVRTACLCCGTPTATFPSDGLICVGFGDAHLSRDGDVVWSEPQGPEDDAAVMTGAQAEALAATDPDHDWRIVIYGPLSGRTYQRHATNTWFMVEQNEGFA